MVGSDWGQMKKIKVEKKVLWHRQTLDVSVRSAHDHTKYTNAHHVSFNNFNLLIGDQCAREAD